VIKPPSDEEIFLFSRSNKNSLYFLGAITLSFLLSGMFLFIYFNPEMKWVYLPFILITVFYLIASYAVGIFGKEFDLKSHKEFINVFNPLHYKDNIRPTVDIFYTCCGEDIKTQENALNSIVKLQLFYGENASIYILDDSKEGMSKPLYYQFLKYTNNIFYIQRDDRPYLKKAGNLRNAFRITNGEYIVIFDADFTPALNFLYHTLPYLEHYPKIGIVQTPQFFQPGEQASWVSYGTAYVQELFYRLIQVSRQSFNGSICVGTNAVYRRSSLEPFGGTADIPYSEDVRTGFRVTANNQLVKYIPVNLAKGLCPDTLPAFFLQQHRWALGSIDLFFSKEFWLGKITFMQRICYLSGMLYYISTGIGVVFINIPSLYLLSFKPEMILWFNIIFSLPSFLFGTLYNAYWSKFGWKISALMSRQVSYYANLFALIERITGNLTPWQATGVATKTKLYTKFQDVLLINAVLTYTIVIACIFYHSASMPFYNFIPTLFFQSLNFYISMRILKDQI
jgi:cellulose synthase/poly-beta-1,6-N-acetylglucosamine synthase-like glycosyltransferase